MARTISITIEADVKREVDQDEIDYLRKIECHKNKISLSDLASMLSMFSVVDAAGYIVESVIDADSVKFKILIP